MSKSVKGKQDIKFTSLIDKSSIENIKKASSALNQELNAETRLTNLTNAQTGSKIAKLQEKGTFYAKQIELEAKKLEEIEKQIALVQQSINEKRARIQKDEGNSSEMLTKQVKMLQRKLEKILQKHNEIQANNKQLKDEIDHLRRERVTFDKIYTKLESELEEKKDTLTEVFKNAEMAKERKRDIEEQIKSLKVKVRNEEQNIEKEFQEVFKDINEKNVKDRIEEKFGTVKERTSYKREASPTSGRVLPHAFEDSVVSPNFSRMSMHKSIRGMDKTQNYHKYHGKTPQEEVEEYNAIFESLKQKTNKSDLKDILTLFEEYENKNYSLYQHLSHLSDERDALEKQINKLKDEISHLTVSQRENTESDADNKAQKITELKKDIEDSDKHYDFLINKQQNMSETINALKISIPIIFERLGCNIEDYADELIDGTTVNEGNMLQYLAIIEKKTNEILQMYHFSQNKPENAIKVNNGYDEKIKKVEENNSASFPEKELLSDLLLAPEKTEMQTAKDFHEFAKEKVKNLMDKKSLKPVK